MQKRHLRSFGVVTLVTGVAFLGGRQAHAMPTMGEPPMFAGAMGETHHAVQGYIGIETRDVSEEQVGMLRLKDAKGAEVTTIDHDGPACKAGMKMHDVILQMNGQAVENEEQLRRMLRELGIGKNVSFVISRDGQNQTLTMTTADRKTIGLHAWEQHYSVPAPGPSGFVHGGIYAPDNNPKPAPQKDHKDLLGTEDIVLSSSFTGAKLELMGPQLAEFFGAAGGAGLLVRSVDGNSPADEAGMKAGDVVVKINSVAVANGNDWTKTVHDNRGKPVPVVVIRDKHEQTLTLTPDGKKRSLWQGLGLEDFFQQTSQQTRQLLAKL
jgi:serine protease Do